MPSHLVAHNELAGDAAEEKVDANGEEHHLRVCNWHRHLYGVGKKRKLAGHFGKMIKIINKNEEWHKNKFFNYIYSKFKKNIFKLLIKFTHPVVVAKHLKCVNLSRSLPQTFCCYLPASCAGTPGWR
jgi:hypothetical protein